LSSPLELFPATDIISVISVFLSVIPVSSYVIPASSYVIPAKAGIYHFYHQSKKSPPITPSPIEKENIF